MTIIIILIIGVIIGFFIYNFTITDQEEHIYSEEFKKRKNDKERNESIIRMANNISLPIEEVKEDYIKDLKKNNIKADFREEMFFQIGVKKIEESISFNISPQNTVTAIMEEWLIEYFDTLKEESSEVDNFIKDNFEMFSKLKNIQKRRLSS
ncbi:hypothetical protein BTO04_14710 [Polaribacter sp. SA4-10]|uniref:hypothetical protein n=1 Tax=Polaribacter sp. SA4-10 TaxID=754397 RepID=UPI000B3D3E65|nr:hypothetical protein [Polaribacter sp. SA4-10]ARV07868.1 hypothetical protein BTO04_14710 [Polaribacter sp. SA4-10]